jgi:vesicle transport through interaction with t-SNAREs 1
MALLFETYEGDFEEAVEMVREKIESIPKLSGEQKRADIASAERFLEDAEETLQTMQLGIRSVNDASTQSDLQARVDEKEDELRTLKRELKEAEVKLSGDRASLFEGASKAIDTSSLSQRERSQATTLVMADDNDYLKEALVTSNRIIDTGGQVMVDLEAQRDRMEQTRDRFRGIDESLSSARRVMSAMWRRIVTNKLIIAGIILILVATIVLVIWIKWGR